MDRHADCLKCKLLTSVTFVALITGLTRWPDEVHGAAACALVSLWSGVTYSEQRKQKLIPAQLVPKVAANGSAHVKRSNTFEAPISAWSIIPGRSLWSAIAI